MHLLFWYKKKLLTPNLSNKNLSKNCYFYPWNIKDLINENKFKESFFHNNNYKKPKKPSKNKTEITSETLLLIGGILLLLEATWEYKLAQNNIK